MAQYGFPTFSLKKLFIFLASPFLVSLRTLNKIKICLQYSSPGCSRKKIVYLLSVDEPGYVWRRKGSLNGTIGESPVSGLVAHLVQVKFWTVVVNHFDKRKENYNDN